LDSRSQREYCNCSVSEPLPWASARRAGTVAIYTRRSSGTPATDTYYVHRDHQGSPELVTNTAGVAVTRFSFSGYGARRDATDWSGPISSGQASLIAGIGRRGYTDHEHLDAVGLVHMNGRVYEPLIGRFLSRDPRINETYLTQAINGYAYVHNSPLSFVDPTGYEGEPIESVVVTATRLRLWIASLDLHLLSMSRLQRHIGLSFGGSAQGGAQGGGQHLAVQPDPVQSETSPPEAAPPAEPEPAEQPCEPPTQEQRAELVWACDGQYDCIRDVNNFVASFGQSSFIDPMQLGKDFIIESLTWGLGTFTLAGRSVADVYGVIQVAQSRGDELMVNSGSTALSILVSRSTRGGSERLQRFGVVYSNSVSRGGDAFLFAVQEYQRKNCQKRPGAGK
jgi:RHS repeat-associated protein